MENGYKPNFSTGDFKFSDMAMESGFDYDKKKGKYICKLCKKKEIEACEKQCHQCYMPHPDNGKKKLSGDEEDIHKYFVFDLECAQESTEKSHNGGTRFKHHCTLICVRAMYDKTKYAKSFDTVESFIEELMTNEIFEKGTLFAHNGGAYDFQFLVTKSNST